MNKKILFGSIIAVVILVLVSFTGVVGYQTTKSTITRASPLFSVRSKRAIDEESRDLTWDYVGKGITTFIAFPKRNERRVLTQNIIKLFDKIDDKEIEDILYQIKSNSDGLKNNNLLIKDRDSSIITFQNNLCILLLIIISILSQPIWILIELKEHFCMLIDKPPLTFW